MDTETTNKIQYVDMRPAPEDITAPASFAGPSFPTPRGGHKHRKGTLKTDLAIQVHELMRERMALENKVRELEGQGETLKGGISFLSEKLQATHNDLKATSDALEAANRRPRCWFCRVRAWWKGGAK